MESLAELRCDCCWRSRLPGIPPTSSPTSTRVRARAPQYCVLLSSLPLYASGETLTSVYADLKGGSVQWWGGGCVYTQIGKEGLLWLLLDVHTHPSSEFFLRRRLWKTEREVRAERAFSFLLQRSWLIAVSDKCFWSVGNAANFESYCYLEWF